VCLMLEQQMKEQGIKSRINETQVYVVTPQKGFIKERIEIITELWNAGVKVRND